MARPSLPCKQRTTSLRKCHACYAGCRRDYLDLPIQPIYLSIRQLNPRCHSSPILPTRNGPRGFHPPQAPWSFLYGGADMRLQLLLFLHRSERLNDRGLPAGRSPGHGHCHRQFSMLCPAPDSGRAAVSISLCTGFCQHCSHWSAWFSSLTTVPCPAAYSGS